MSRPPTMLVLVLVSVAGLASLTAEPPRASPVLAEAPPPRPVAPKARPVLVEAELSKVRAHPGDVIRLTEFVPIEREIRVSRFDHTVHIIGLYNFGMSALVNRDPEQPRYSNGRLVFAGWNGGAVATGDKHFRFDVTNPRQEGMEFEFTARQIGIYMIKAEWTLHGSNEVIESNPVTLTVSPPLDKNGKPIIKEEWIDPITWKHRPR